MILERRHLKVKCAELIFQLLSSFIFLVAFSCGMPEAPSLTGMDSGSHADAPDSTNEYSSKNPLGNSSDTSELAGLPYGVAAWNINCQDPEVPPITQGVSGLVQLIGSGDHRVARNRILKTRMEVEGKWCALETGRAISVAIDVSDDMSYSCRRAAKKCGSDIIANGTCARAQFMKELSVWAQQGHQKLGYVTYSNSRKSRSDGLTFKAEENSEKDLANKFCDSSGTADWSIPLIEAEKQLRELPVNSTKELVIVSAKDVPAAKLTDITARAAALRAKGFSVTVILLNGVSEETTTRGQQISSDDLGGKKFFVQVDNGGKLTDELEAVTRIQIAKEQFQLRAIGASDWTTQEFPIDAAGVAFRHDTGFDIDGGIQSAGFEFQLLQQDTRNRNVLMRGRLLLNN